MPFSKDAVLTQKSKVVIRMIYALYLANGRKILPDLANASLLSVTMYYLSRHTKHTDKHLRNGQEGFERMYLKFLTSGDGVKKRYRLFLVKTEEMAPAIGVARLYGGSSGSKSTPNPGCEGNPYTCPSLRDFSDCMKTGVHHKVKVKFCRG